MDLLAAMTEEEAAAVVGMAATAILVFMIVWFVIVGLVIALIVRPVLERVPPAHRKMGTGGPFLLMIPFFSVIWLFFVTARTSGSLQSYFASVDRTDQGDCGQSVGL